jgi:hypothetical protein
MKHLLFSSMILAAATITGCATDADEPAQAEATDQVVGVGGCTQQVRLGTFYFADRAETNWVGQCLITCAQWVRGAAAPYPGQGATCQGTTPTPYSAPYIGTCHACQE